MTVEEATAGAVFKAYALKHFLMPALSARHIIVLNLRSDHSLEERCSNLSLGV